MSRKRKSTKSVVYFDNNGTTLTTERAAKVLNQWVRCYNPSTDSRIAKPAKQMLLNVRDSILSHCGVSSASHACIFTSGGSESNCFIIRACVKAFKKKLLERGSEMIPHVILSSVEHNASMQCVADLLEQGEIDVSYIKPSIYGNVLVEDVEREIRPNTCLISIMYANNEIPVINNIREIGAMAENRRIPLHSDCVQVFGKFKVNLHRDRIQALSASAHKFYGPKGVGLLIISKMLIDGYGLKAEISGNQQGGLRGGTENVAAIASMLEAMKVAFQRRKQKNAKLYQLRLRFLKGISKHYRLNKYINYLYQPSEREQKQFDDNNDEKKNEDDPNYKEDVELVSLGPPEENRAYILPNTVLLSICKNRGRPFCNIDLKHYLDSKGFIVSIGSACSTDSKKASHVMDAIGAPSVIRRGTIRISFGDQNTVTEVDRFVTELKNAIQIQCRDLDRKIGY